MIALQPNVMQVGEATILGDFLRREVVVVVGDGARGRVVVVEALGRVGFEEEVVVDEHDGVSRGDLKSGDLSAVVHHWP